MEKSVPFWVFELLLGFISHFLLVNCNFLTKQYLFKLESSRAIFLLQRHFRLFSANWEVFALAENVISSALGSCLQKCMRTRWVQEDLVLLFGSVCSRCPAPQTWTISTSAVGTARILISPNLRLERLRRDRTDRSWLRCSRVHLCPTQSPANHQKVRFECLSSSCGTSSLLPSVRKCDGFEPGCLYKL